MPKDNNTKVVEGSVIRRNDGYQPLREGYQPREKRGYSPITSSGNNGGGNPKPPKGGTGQSSGKG